MRLHLPVSALDSEKKFDQKRNERGPSRFRKDRSRREKGHWISPKAIRGKKPPPPKRVQGKKDAERGAALFSLNRKWGDERRESRSTICSTKGEEKKSQKNRPRSGNGGKKKPKHREAVKKPGMSKKPAKDLEPKRPADEETLEETAPRRQRARGKQ